MKPQLIDVNLSGTKAIQIKNVDQFYLDAPFHFHPLCELVWVQQSFGKRIVGDDIDNFADGDLVLMGPNLPHIWQNDPVFLLKKKGFRVKATVIYFPANFLLTLTDDPDVLKPTNDLIKRASGGLSFFGETRERVSEILSNISNAKGFKKIIYFLQVIDVLAGSRECQHLAGISFKNHFDEKDTDRINKIYQFLIQNFHRDISLDEIADICFMTPNSFCRFFKSRTQKSLTQFLNELRIGHACKLLQNEDYSVSDVCYECGYNNTANFNKFFKAITKKTPSVYRQKLSGS